MSSENHLSRRRFVKLVGIVGSALATNILSPGSLKAAGLNPCWTDDNPYTLGKDGPNCTTFAWSQWNANPLNVKLPSWTGDAQGWRKGAESSGKYALSQEPTLNSIVVLGAPYTDANGNTVTDAGKFYTRSGNNVKNGIVPTNGHVAFLYSKSGTTLYFRDQAYRDNNTIPYRQWSANKNTISKELPGIIYIQFPGTPLTPTLANNYNKSRWLAQAQDQRFVVVARGSDNTIKLNIQGAVGGYFGGWQDLGGSLVNDPT